MSRSRHKMALNIPLPARGQLDADMRKYFDVCDEKLGFVPNVLACYSFDQGKLRAFANFYNDLMLAESELTKCEREMIAVVVSSANHCYYCLTAHGAAVRKLSGDPLLGEMLVMNYRAADLAPRQRAMLDFAHRLTVDPQADFAPDRRALAEAGSAVVLNGLGAAVEIAKTREQLAADFGVKVGYSPADMASPAAIADMVAAALAEHGRLDVLVNNAGIQHVAPIEQFPVEKWDAILAINLSSAFHTTRAVLPAMRRNGFGRIVNIASAHGLVASPFKAAYVAAKHGIVGLSKVTALETAEAGITCNAICPGYVYTPLVEAQIDGQAKAHGISRDQVIRDVLLAQQPNKRFASVEELGALTVFLASDAAASITGIALPVDGGWTAH